MARLMQVLAKLLRKAVNESDQQADFERYVDRLKVDRQREQWYLDGQR